MVGCHEIAVTLQVSRDRMVSCSSDGNVRVWDFIVPAPKTGKGKKDPAELIQPTVIHQAHLKPKRGSWIFSRSYWFTGRYLGSV